MKCRSESTLTKKVTCTQRERNEKKTHEIFSLWHFRVRIFCLTLLKWLVELSATQRPLKQGTLIDIHARLPRSVTLPSPDCVPVQPPTSSRSVHTHLARPSAITRTVHVENLCCFVEGSSHASIRSSWANDALSIASSTFLLLGARTCHYFRCGVAW